MLSRLRIELREGARLRWGSVVCKRRVLLWKAKPVVSIFQDRRVASDLERHVARLTKVSKGALQIPQ